MSLLGNFLEISISTPDPLHDLAWFEQFRFQPLVVNEVRSHRYGVMGDGRIHFGLHRTTFTSPSLTFVLPDLRAHIPALLAVGIEFEYIKLGDDEFNEAGFVDASGHQVMLLEARTFSPTLPIEKQMSEFGLFSHLVLPDINNNAAFWQKFQLGESLLPNLRIEFDNTFSELTAVFTHDIESLILRGAREGWNHFSVTQDNHGLIKSPFGINFLIKEKNPDV